MIADAFIKAAYRRGRSDREKGITTNPYHKPSQTELYEAWERGNATVEAQIRTYDPSVGVSIAKAGEANLSKLQMLLSSKKSVAGELGALFSYVGAGKQGESK